MKIPENLLKSNDENYSTNHSNAKSVFVFDDFKQLLVLYYCFYCSFKYAYICFEARNYLVKESSEARKSKEKQQI